LSGHAADHHHADSREDTAVSQKELVIETIRQLPEEVTIDEIVEEIALLAAIRKREQDADSGRVVSHEHVRETVAAWLSTS
jgi:predicted transcriptional regulator